MRLSTLLLRVSTVLLLVGLCMGIFMAMKADYRLMPAHAHLNLVGFVIMFLAGLYYRMVPEAETMGLAKLHSVLHIAAAIIMAIGIALLKVVDLSYEPIAVVGSVTFLVSMIIFAFVVYRTA